MSQLLLYPVSRQSYRRLAEGFSLIELLVVLTILTAIGGLVVPQLSGFNTRTHTATSPTNLNNLTKLIQVQASSGGELGDFWETGIVATGDTGALFPDGPAATADEPVNNQVPGGAASDLSAETLSVDEVAALNAVGIDNVMYHAPSEAGYDITFTPGGDAAAFTALTDTTPVIVLSDAQAEEIFLATGDGEKYVWFGIGRDNELMEKGLFAEPPVHYGDDPALTPKNSYQRFGVVLQIADSEGALSFAEFKKVSYCVDGEAFETSDNHHEVHYLEVIE